MRFNPLASQLTFRAGSSPAACINRKTKTMDENSRAASDYMVGPDGLFTPQEQSSCLARLGHAHQNDAALSYLNPQAGMFSQAVASLQSYQGNVVTGVWDAPTQLAYLSRPCGCPDILPEEMQQGQLRRWSHTDLKVWHDMSLVSKDTFMSAMREWSKHTPLTFEWAKDQRDADIYAVAARIDGRNGTLADAFLPHSPSNRGWQSRQRYDVADGAGYWTIVHEGGHSLGLSHSPSRSDIMYFAMIGNDKLGDGDVRDIQRRYGEDASPDPVDPKPPIAEGILRAPTDVHFSTEGNGDREPNGHIRIAGGQPQPLFWSRR